MEQLEGIDISEESELGDEAPSLKQIALFHIKRLSTLCSQELTPGYWENKPIKVAGGVVMSKTYKPDLRIAFVNAIDFLTMIVYPYSDDKFKALVDKMEEIEEKEEIKIEDKIKIKRKLFKEMNIMFERVDFFNVSEGASEISQGV